jgi:hypothetical protein
VANAINTLECNICDGLLRETCDYTCAPGPGTGCPPPGQKIEPRPTACSPSCPAPSGPTPKGSRRKRQTGEDLRPAPGQDPVPQQENPPPVNADFDNDAKFLKQFMELDPQTRYSIGHRFVKKSLKILGLGNSIAQDIFNHL